MMPYEQPNLFDPIKPQSVTKEKNIFLAQNTAYLEEHFLSTLRSDQSHAQQKHLILVHSNLLASHLKYKLAQKPLPAYPLHFITFIDLAKILLKYLAIPLDKLLLKRDLELMKLYDLCQQTFHVDFPNSDLFFLNNKTGFIQSLQQSYAHMQQNKITQWPNSQEELVSLHTQYNDTFLKQCFTQDSLIALAEHTLTQRQNHDIPALPFKLCVYGFHELSPIQHSLINQAPVQGRQLWMLKNQTDQNPTPNGFDQTWQVEPIASPCNEQPTVIQSLACDQQGQEIQQCVDTLIQWIKEDPNVLKKTAVLSPEQSYLSACQQAFAQASIPFYAPMVQTFAQTFLGRALHVLCSYRSSLKNRFELDQLMCEFPFAKDLVSPQQQKELFDCLNTHNILDEAHFLNLTFSTPSIDAFKQFLKHLHGIFSPLSNWDRLFTQLNDFLLHYLDASAYLNDPSNAQYTSVWLDLQSAYQTFDHLNIPCTENHIDFFLKHFFNRHCPDPTQKLHQSGVFLAPIEHAAFFNFDRLIVLGLNQDHFPKPDQHLPLLDNPDLSPTVLPQTHSQDLQINVLKNIVASAQHGILSYARHNVLNDQDMQPSVVFDHLTCQTIDAPTKQDSQVHTPLQFHQQVLASHIKIHGLDDLSKLSENLSNQAVWAQEHLTEHPRFSSYSGQLPALLKSKQTFSVSALQRYATCPYQYFLSTVLNLKNYTWPEDVYGLHYLDKGQLIHQILFLLYQRYLQSPGAELEQKMTWLKDIVNQQQQEQHTLKKDQLWNKEILGVYQMIQSYISDEHFQSSEFNPLALELRFGQFKSEDEDARFSSDEALHLTHQGQDLYFRGKIDRLDMHHDQQHLHVIDYKTGSVASKKNNDFQNGQNIQLAIYLLVCEKLFPKIPLENMNASMISVDPKQGFAQKHLEGAFLHAHRDDFLNLIFSLCKHLNQGKFVQNPGSNASHCRNCDFTSICQSHVQKRAQDIQQDPQLHDLMEVL